MWGQGHTRYDPQNMTDTMCCCHFRSKLHFSTVSFIANVLFCRHIQSMHQPSPKIIFPIKNDVFAVVYMGLLNMPVRETRSAVSN